MNNRWIFEKKVNAITVILFILGMLVLFFFDWLPIWAATMASLFVAVSLRQFLVGKPIDIVASIVIFGALFITNSLYYSEWWTGSLLITGAGYIFIRQCFEIQAYRSSHKASSQKQHDSRDDYPDNDS